MPNGAKFSNSLKRPFSSLSTKFEHPAFIDICLPWNIYFPCKQFWIDGKLWIWEQRELLKSCVRSPILKSLSQIPFSISFFPPSPWYFAAVSKESFRGSRYSNPISFFTHSPPHQIASRVRLTNTHQLKLFSLTFHWYALIRYWMVHHTLMTTLIIDSYLLFVNFGTPPPIKSMSNSS